MSRVDGKIPKNCGKRELCVRAMAWNLAFGSASTNRRLSTERGGIEVGNLPEGDLEHGLDEIIAWAQCPKILREIQSPRGSTAPSAHAKRH